MKKTGLIAIVSLVIGFVAGNAFWYLASPLWIDVEVSEGTAAGQTETILARGEFHDVDGVHKGSGTATIYEGADGATILRFEGFQVTNGPDLKVWLVKAPNVASSDDVLNSEYLALGRLKGNIGDQNYTIPPGTDISAYKSVTIWCEQFSVLMSAAALAP